MKSSRLLALSALALVACSHDVPDAASPRGDALPGNAAVQARLGALPAPPIPWTTPVGTLVPADFEGLCPYLAANVPLEGSTVQCPDGSTAEVAAYACDPMRLTESARALPCTISFGEIIACRLAMVAHPCDGGPLGENLEECQAFDACTCTTSRSALDAGATP
jgi:hypothetical protein